MAKYRALAKIEQLSTESLAEALTQNGFQECFQLILDKNINGRQFLNLTEFQLKQYHMFLDRAVLRRLWSYILRIKEHPEEFFPVSTGAVTKLSKPPKPPVKSSSVRRLNTQPSQQSVPPLLTTNNNNQIHSDKPPIMRDSKPPLKNILVPKGKEVKSKLQNNLSSDDNRNVKSKLETNFTNTRTIPAESLENSFRNNIDKLSSSIAVESETSSNDSFSDNEWLDDAIEVLEINDGTKVVEESLEERRNSAESFKSNREKLKQIFQGRRPEAPQELPQPIKVPVKQEPSTLPLKPSEMKTVIYENLRDVQQSKMAIQHKPIITGSSDFDKKRQLLSATLSASLKSQESKAIRLLPPKPPAAAKSLPIPPKSLPPRLTLDETSIPLLPQQPPKYVTLDIGNDEQIEFLSDDEVAHPPSIDVKGKRLPPPPVIPEEFYEPSPTIESVPNTLRHLDAQPPVPRRNAIKDPGIDEEGYLITISQLNNSNESRIRHLDRPLPPVPAMPSGVRRNQYFKDITRKEAEMSLKGKPIGSFVLRPSRKYYCTLVIRAMRRFLNIPLVYFQDEYYLLNDDSAESLTKFNTLDELIEYYMRNNIIIGAISILLK